MTTKNKPGLTRVNVRSVANTKAVKKEMRNGRSVVIVPSATLPDDVVMNNVRYPADEIARSFGTLEDTPAPLGHPSLPDGAWLSASQPEGINRSWIGAWNENVRQENGVVLLDKVIDVEVANRSDGGRAVLAAIDAGEPIHTSTGVYAVFKNAEEDDDAELVATNIVFDHDAILLNEEGAATPEQGVGMLVNRKTPNIPVVNSQVEWAEEQLSWAAEHLLDSAERLDRAKEREALIPRLVDALKGLVSGDSAATNETVQKEETMDAETKAAIDAVNTKLDGIPEAIGTAVTNALKPLVDAQEAATNAAKEAEEAERSELTETIVNAALRDEDECKHLPIANLRKIAKDAKPGSSQAIGNGAGDPNNTVQFKIPGQKEA